MPWLFELVADERLRQLRVLNDEDEELFVHTCS
jgi:hypothetical protein